MTVDSMRKSDFSNPTTIVFYFEFWRHWICHWKKSVWFKILFAQEKFLFVWLNYERERYIKKKADVDHNIKRCSWKMCFLNWQNLWAADDSIFFLDRMLAFFSSRGFKCNNDRKIWFQVNANAISFWLEYVRVF